MNRTVISLAALPLVMATGCSSNPAPAAPTPQPAPPAAAAPAATPAPAPAPAAAAAAPSDLVGSWDFTVDVQGQVIGGEMVLTLSGSSWGGTVTPQGMSPATVRTVTIRERRVSIVIDTPDGEATFEGDLSTDGRTLSGSVAFQGQSLGFNARKR